MTRKSIFGGMKDHVAQRIERKVGARVSAPTGSIYLGFVNGVVLEVHEDVHGTLLLIRNAGSTGFFRGHQWYTGGGFSTDGWPVIPVWVSKCGGASGVVAMWKDEAVLKMVAECRFTLDADVKTRSAMRRTSEWGSESLL